MFALESVVIGGILGLVLGMLGGGGAILAVPALVYLLNVSPHAAVAASLVIVGLAASSGLLSYGRAGRVAWRTAATFGLTGAIGSFAGAWLNQRVPGERLLALLGLLMLIAAVLIIRRPAVSNARPRGGVVRQLGLGLGVGLLTGFFGVGGGFVIVPALTLGLGLPMNLTIGTSLAIIVLNSLAGVLGYLKAGTIDWSLTVPVAVGSVTGALLGSRLAGRLPERQLRRGFAGLVSLVAVYLVYRNAAAWLVFATLPG